MIEEKKDDGGLINLLEVIQEEDKQKAIRNMDYIMLSLDNVELGFRQFLLDLPLDYHDKDMNDLIKREIKALRDTLEDYKEKVL